MTPPIRTWLARIVLVLGALASPAAMAETGKVLDIQGKVLDIVGVARDVSGLLKDLGAKVTDQEISIELAADVLFDFDKHTLRPDATASLTKVGEVLKSYGSGPIRIDGHTDGKGADDYNKALSERRAQSVKDWFVKNAGVDGRRIATRGLGKAQPKVANTKPDGSDDPDGRQKNRRVEITVKKS
jgi:outer membrane protein OmpA-like peptidoglycan-associated protein